MKANVILCDPPWAYDSYSDKGQQRSAEHHYPTMSMQDIYDLAPLIKELSAPNSALFLWVSTPNLPNCLKIMEHWGFTYKTKAFAWVKRKASNATLYQYVDKYDRGQIDRDHLISNIASNAFKMNLGKYTRAATEDCYLGVKGRMSREDASIHQELVDYEEEMVPAPIEGHSVKPYTFHQRIEKLFGPNTIKVELFARVERPGWICLGNEIDGKDIRDAMKELL